MLRRATSQEEQRKSLGVGGVGKGKGEAHIGLMCGAMRQERVGRRLGARQADSSEAQLKNICFILRAVRSPLWMSVRRAMPS